MRTWRGPLVAALTVSLLGACASQPVVSTPRTYQGAGVGAVVGGGAGAVIDKDNRWRGAALGRSARRRPGRQPDRDLLARGP